MTISGSARKSCAQSCEQGYTNPTPIQEQAIPLVAAGPRRDGPRPDRHGQDGSLRAADAPAAAPHANTSFSPARHPVRALILTPTRELAVQVYDSFRTYGRHVPLRYAVVYGGVPIEPQTKELLAGVEVLVATPGRLLDHVGQRTVNLGQVEILVLDEADRMLDMGFLPDIRRIVDMLPNRNQTLLFSATFSSEIRALARTLLQRPGVGRHRAPDHLGGHGRPGRLPRRLGPQARAARTDRAQAQPTQVLVFTRTKLMAGRLASQLDRDGVEAISIHGDRSQPERERALADFKSGAVRVLVATDVAARGLDIDALPVVVNYELPHTPHDYVHRIGRTGRAGAAGEAISLVAPEEEDYLKQINRLLKRDLPVRVVKGFEPTLGAAARASDLTHGSRIARCSTVREHRHGGQQQHGDLCPSSLTACHLGSKTMP